MYIVCFYCHKVNANLKARKYTNNHYTYLFLGPGNKPLFVITGEGHRDELVSYVGNTLRHFASRLSNTAIPISLNSHVKAKDVNSLYFPSKVCDKILLLIKLFINYI